MKTNVRVRQVGAGLALILAVIGLAGQVGQAPRPAQSAAGFADPAFERVWTRTDLLVAQGAVGRTWLWGPTPGLTQREPWAESPGGTRLVQYFDKGRMELTDPNANPNDPYYVSGGLLAEELIAGQVQTGQARYVQAVPAIIPIAGDRGDANAPTYAGFAGVSNTINGDHRAADATGQPVAQAINRAGTVGPLVPPQQDYGVRYSYFEPLTGHNVPDVFWTFLNAPGTVLENGQVGPGRLFDPPFRLTGLPISEAYWARVQIAGGVADVLIQAFERRVLTYAPNNPEGFKVEMGNIGLAYVEWRYGGPVPTPRPAPAGPPPDVRIVAIANAQAGLVLNSQTITLQNATDKPVDLTGWRLVAPNGDHDTPFTLPAINLPAGGTVTIYAGWGYNSPTAIYMRRLTWYFPGKPFDGVLLYDTLNREVSRFFLVGGQPPPPAGTPVPPAPTQPGSAQPTDTPPPEKGTPSSGAPTSTPTLPAPVASGTPKGLTPTATATMTATPGGEDTATPTPSVFPSGTPTPHAAGDGVALIAWVSSLYPHENDSVTVFLRITRNGTPVPGVQMAALWEYANGDTTECGLTSDSTGTDSCAQVMPAGSAGTTIWIDALAQIGSTFYTTYAGVRPQH